MYFYGGYMKKLTVLFLCITCFLFPVAAQETIVLNGSNQNITTMGFEMNEYDYLLNPLYFGELTDPWVFFALDNSGVQFAEDLVSSGFRAGWAPGGEMTPVFMGNYRTVMSQLDTAREEDNIEYDSTGYDSTTGLYATITETVDEGLKTNRHIHDAVLHGGFSLSESLAMAFQFAMAMDLFSIESLAYTNTYSNTAAASEAALTSKGNRTEKTGRMRANSENSYLLDIEAGLRFGDIESRIVLGTGWYSPGSGSNSHEQILTIYNDGGGVDDTVRDQVSVTTYTGQYYLSSATGTPTASFSMGTTGLDYAEYLSVGIGSETTLPLDGGWYLSAPFDFQINLYPGDTQTMFNDVDVYYDDSSAEGTETRRDATTITTTLLRPVDLRAATGAGIGTSVEPSENTRLHFGGAFDFAFDAVSETKSQQRVQRYQEDNDGDQAYTTAGTDVDYTYTESGYEEQNRVFQYDFDLGFNTGLSYSPAAVLTFHAGASVGLGVDLTSTSTLVTGSSGFVYEQYTDNLDSTNTYTLRQKDGSSTESTPSTLFSTDVNFSTAAVFGFTLDFSDNFKVDARATAGDVGFDEFSVLAMYSY